MSQAMDEPLGRQALAGAQMLFVAFGALEIGRASCRERV